jgi:hypothetical protein
VCSLNEISQPYINLTTRQVNISDYTFGDPIGMFEIRRPSVDIIVRLNKILFKKMSYIKRKHVYGL